MFSTRFHIYGAFNAPASFFDTKKRSNGFLQFYVVYLDKIEGFFVFFIVSEENKVEEDFENFPSLYGFIKA